VEPTVIVYAKPLPRGGIDGDPVWDEPSVVRSVETRRVPDAALPSGAKTHNYLNGILARAELEEGADEALLRDLEGSIAEGATSNLFFLSDGVLRTPGADGDLLPGITRRVVLELADEAGVSVEEGRYGLEDVLEADEAFLTNRTWELRPVASLDGREIGGGDVWRRLSRLYDERVEKVCY
jgi:branched-chain amino acid aminotransferase